MRDTLKKLIEIQKKDSQIYELGLILEKFPVELENLNENEKLAQEDLKRVQDEYKNLEINRKNQEIEIDSFKEKILKYDAQLFSIKDNNEYKAMIKQIEDAKTNISEMEDRLLYMLEDLDKINEEVKLKQENLETEKKLLLEKQTEVKSRENGIKDQIKNLKLEKENLAKDIDNKIFSIYENILENRKDRAIVPIDHDCCSACNMVLLAHIIDEAKGCGSLITCDTCSRILYDKESVEFLNE